MSENAQTKPRRRRRKRFDHNMVPLGFELTYAEYAKRRRWDRIDGFDHKAMESALNTFRELWRSEMRRMVEREDLYDFERYEDPDRLPQQVDNYSDPQQLVDEYRAKRGLNFFPDMAATDEIASPRPHLQLVYSRDDSEGARQ